MLATKRANGIIRKYRGVEMPNKVRQSLKELFAIYWRSLIRVLILFGCGVLFQTRAYEGGNIALFYGMFSFLSYLGAILILAGEHAEMVVICFVAGVFGVVSVLVTVILVVPQIMPYLFEMLKELLRYFFPRVNIYA